MKDRVNLVPRIFAVLAASFLVIAFAMAALLPAQLQLDQLLESIDRVSYAGFVGYARIHFPGWVTQWVIMPIVLRPCWLVPATLGMLFAGASGTIISRPNATRSRRRRS